MRLISWNVNGRRGPALERQLAAMVDRAPDLVALQEVRADTVAPWRDGLRGAGLGHVLDSGDGLSLAAPNGQDYRRRYFNLVASRRALQRLPSLQVAFPERYL